MSEENKGEEMPLVPVLQKQPKGEKKKKKTVLRFKKKKRKKKVIK